MRKGVTTVWKKESTETAQHTRARTAESGDTKMLINNWKTIVTNHTKLFNMYLMVICCLISFINCETIVEEYDVNNSLYLIEGKVYAPEIYTANDFNWQRDTVITINNGEYNGYLKEDGTFIINGVPSGSYVVEVSNPDYYYESVHNHKSVLVCSKQYFHICLTQWSVQLSTLGTSRNQSER